MTIKQQTYDDERGKEKNGNGRDEEKAHAKDMASNYEKYN